MFDLIIIILENILRFRLRLVRVKRLSGKCFPENDLRENILREKKKRKIDRKSTRLNSSHRP